MTLKYPSHRISTLGLLLMGVSSSNIALAKDIACIDYFTVGDSNCQPVASTPIKVSSTEKSVQLIPPQPKDEVDKYLDNYGKPPREFVEFYLNPTSENAQKWVGAYQQLLQKGQAMSKAWGDAEQLYTPAGMAPGSNLGGAMPSALPIALPPALPQLISQPAAAPSVSIGAFSAQRGTVSLGGVGTIQEPVNLTYYFSQVCPYCARLTPDLATLSKEKEGKLELTCVDVTPATDQSGPNPSYITAKLPCKWRLPESGEIISEDVRQTPTMIIRKGAGEPVRLSGYVPLAQLRQYF